MKNDRKNWEDELKELKDDGTENFPVHPDDYEEVSQPAHVEVKQQFTLLS